MTVHSSSEPPSRRRGRDVIDRERAPGLVRHAGLSLALVPEEGQTLYTVFTERERGWRLWCVLQNRAPDPPMPPRACVAYGRAVVRPKVSARQPFTSEPLRPAQDPDHGHHGNGLDEIKCETNAGDGICLFEEQVDDALTNPRKEYRDCQSVQDWTGDVGGK